MKNTILFLMLFILISSCRTVGIGNEAGGTTVKQELNYIPYYLTMYKADSLFLIDDFKGSYKLLDSLFKIYPPLATDNYGEYGIYVSSAVMSGNLKDIDRKVRYGYSKFGGVSTLHFKYAEIREAVNEAADLSEAEIIQLKKDYANSLNATLRERLRRMHDEDQAIRLNGGSYEEMGVIDDRNEKELENIFEEYGYPRKELIGTTIAYDLPGPMVQVAILFLHQSDEFKIKYLPILLDYVKKGQCDPETYASVYDKFMLQTGRKQYFGSFTASSDPDDISPVSNPMKLDSIRASIGLSPIKYYPWKLRAFDHD